MEMKRGKCQAAARVKSRMEGNTSGSGSGSARGKGDGIRFDKGHMNNTQF